METQLVIPGYETLYPNAVFGKDVDGSRLKLLNVTRYTVPSRREILDLIVKEAKLLTSNSDIFVESASKKRLRNSLRELEEVLKFVAAEEPSTIDHIKEHMARPHSDGNYLWISGGILNRLHLPNPERADQFGPYEYESQLYDKGTDVWNVRIQIAQKIPNLESINHSLDSVTRDSDMFYTDSSKQYPELSKLIRLMYAGLNGNSDPELFYDDSKVVTDNITSRIVNRVSMCYKVAKRLGQELDVLRSHLESQTGSYDVPDHLGPDFFSKN